MVALELEVNSLAKIEKLAVVAPAGTVTPLGTNNWLWLEDSVMGRPPAGAGPFKLIVQVPELPDAREEGLQARPETVVAASKLKENVREAPPAEAVTTALELTLSVLAVTVKLALVAPAGTVTDEGTISEALLVDTPTAVPPVGAAALRVTVQVLTAPEVSELGLQVKLVGVAGTTRPIEAVREVPLSEAVTVAVVLELIVPVVAVKLADEAPAGTAMDEGTVSADRLEDSATLAPPVGAEALSVTVQVLLDPDDREVGLQVRLVGVTGTTRLSEKVREAPPAEAVTTAVELTVSVAAVTVKLEEVAPAGTVTEEGADREALSEDTATAVPPVGAAALRVTVQVLLEPEFSESGLQVRLVGVTGTTRLSERVREAPPAEAVTTAVELTVSVPAVTVKLEEVAPAGTVTEEGADREALSEDTATAVPPVGAAALRVTVQVLLEPEFSESGLQVRLVGVAGTTRLSEKVREAPPAEAVTTAVELTVSAPAVTVKLEEVAPAGTVTEEGADREALSEDTATAVPPMGAAALRVTVQVLLEPEFSESGLQVRLVGVAGTTRLIEVVREVPLSEAVTVAVVLELIVPVVAVKLADVAPAGTATDEGTVSADRLEDSATLAPPVGAAALSVTVQVLLEPDDREVGLQVRLVGVTGTTRLSEKVREAPPAEAVTTAVELTVSVPAVTVKLEEVAPAGIVTEDGTVSALLLEDTATAVPPVGAAALRVTVQVLLEPEFSESGLQVRLVGVAGTTRLIEVVREVPLSEAVTVAVVLELIVPVVAVKLADVAPAGTATDEGTVSADRLEDSATLAPPVGAAALSVTVQVLLDPDDREVGLQVRLVGVAGGTRLIEKVRELPPAEAVTTAVELAVRVPAVTVKLEEVAPAGIVTEDGTVSALLLEDTATATPPMGAAALRATVHVPLKPEDSDVGLQLREERTDNGGATVTTPPEPEEDMAEPTDDVAILSPTRTGLSTLVLEESVRETVAITPLGMEFVFSPTRRHLTEPAALAQCKDLPALTTAGVGTTLTDE